MLGDHGFNGLTIQALAARCNISNAGLLYYFRTKEDILVGALDAFDQRERLALGPLVDHVRSLSDQGLQAWSAFLALLDELVARFDRRPDLARLLIILQVEAIDATHAAHEWFRSREAMTLDLLATLMAPFSTNPMAVARHVVAAMQGLLQHWLRMPGSFDLAGEWTALSRAVLGQCDRRPSHHQFADISETTR